MRPYHSLALTLLLTTTAAAHPNPITARSYPAPTAPLTTTDLPPATQLVTVRTADALNLHGLLIPPKTGQPLLLLFHGNGSSAADALRWFAPLIEQGYGVLAAEYRGYSANPGEPDEPGHARDADAFFAFAQSQAPQSPLWIVGHSLGAGVAFGLSQRQPLTALITIGAFTRLRDAAPRIARAFVPDAYHNRDAIPALDEPWFLIHGTADDVIPVAQGEALHAAAGAAHKPGASFVILGADHHPDAALLVPVFAAIGRDLTTGALSADGMPGQVKLVPFGQRAPVNP
jgi:dipeptidyl aminopeptidase/acylaminoacyl peptidase